MTGGDAAPGLAGRRVLVTGAAGFIGSHLVERLARDGARVTCLVNYNALSSIGNLMHLEAGLRAGTRIEFGTIEDGDYLLRLADGHDVIIHLAALIGIPYSYVSPRSYVRTNIEGTLNVLEAARRSAVGRVIHTSTSEVYGTAQYQPIDEKHPLQGQSPYSASKIAADKLAEAFALSFAVPVVTLRPFNCYGPRQSARAFVPAVILQALGRGKVMLGSLTPKRDMTYIADTVDGFARAATIEGLDREVINLGSGISRSIGEFAEDILKVMESEARIEQDPARMRPEASEVSSLIADAEKARRLLGWTAAMPFDEGVRRTRAFFAEHLETYDVERYAV
jgi:NAD dependent epimerase/dehydratase